MFAAHPELLRVFNQGNQATGEQSKALAGSVVAYAVQLIDPMRRRSTTSCAALPISTSPWAFVQSSTRSSASTSRQANTSRYLSIFPKGTGSRAVGCRRLVSATKSSDPTSGPHRARRTARSSRSEGNARSAYAASAAVVLELMNRLPISDNSAATSFPLTP
jgi:hypothetical protein